MCMPHAHCSMLVHNLQNTKRFNKLVMYRQVQNEKQKQGLIFEEHECDRAPSRSSKLFQERMSLHSSAVFLVDRWNF